MSISALRIKALERFNMEQNKFSIFLILFSGIYQIKGKRDRVRPHSLIALALIPFKGEVNLDGRGVKSSAYKLKGSQSTPAFPDFLSGRDMIDLFARLKRAI